MDGTTVAVFALATAVGAQAVPALWFLFTTRGKAEAAGKVASDAKATADEAIDLYMSRVKICANCRLEIEQEAFERHEKTAAMIVDNIERVRKELSGAIRMLTQRVDHALGGRQMHGVSEEL